MNYKGKKKADSLSVHFALRIMQSTPTNRELEIKY
jgi:hypothetical protein